MYLNAGSQKYYISEHKISEILRNENYETCPISEYGLTKREDSDYPLDEQTISWPTPGLDIVTLDLINDMLVIKT